MNMLIPVTEADYARYLERSGKQIIERSGRYWYKQLPGFYQPIHYMARMAADEANRPSNLCWGYRTTLRESDWAQANGSLPVHILSNLQDYDLPAIKQTRRTQLRKCWKMVEIIHLDQPDILLEQGYGVIVSDHGRHGYGKLESPEEFRQRILRCFKWNFVTIVGVRDGKLGGFAIGSAIGPTAYLEDIAIHSEFLESNLCAGLTYELAQACRRSPGITELVHGLHAREKESLCTFKTEHGFKVEHIPSKVWFAPFCSEFIRQRRPHAYYRLCGHD